MSRRMEKVADLLQGEIADLLQRRVRDPSLEDVMISITHIDITADLAHARVHVSVMADDLEQRAVMDALGRSSSFLHRELVRRIHLRRVPRLHFELDNSIAEGARLASLLHEVLDDDGPGPDDQP
ncbi:MAG: 30S ribosome-binding factor RbfA [Chloroflexi bacterium]|nr:30S ribosome-binding factor RbfA [Chloroflexota bacterium]